MLHRSLPIRSPVNSMLIGDGGIRLARKGGPVLPIRICMEGIFAMGSRTVARFSLPSSETLTASLTSNSPGKSKAGTVGETTLHSPGFVGSVPVWRPCPAPMTWFILGKQGFCTVSQRITARPGAAKTQPTRGRAFRSGVASSGEPFVSRPVWAHDDDLGPGANTGN